MFSFVKLRYFNMGEIHSVLFEKYCTRKEQKLIGYILKDLCKELLFSRDMIICLLSFGTVRYNNSAVDKLLIAIDSSLVGFHHSFFSFI